MEVSTRAITTCNNVAGHETSTVDGDLHSTARDVYGDVLRLMSTRAITPCNEVAGHETGTWTVDRSLHSTSRGVSTA